ncbi:MAG: cobalamin-dependent protein [Bryobacteraceae bacterium]|nr:cobalamin-dependent protein [Bryobacteraceae bacterium]
MVGIDQSFAGLAGGYLQCLLSGNGDGAWHLVKQAMADGVPIRDLYLQVFQPCQYEVGRLWEANEATVAQEHYCTAATQTIMSRLHARVFSAERTGRSAVVVGVGGELHEIGARMVADFLEMKGWDTRYLGPNLPPDEISRNVIAHDPDLVCLSCTMTYHVSLVEQTVAGLREAKARAKVLVGGLPFNRDPELWRRTGADGWAPDAGSLVDWLRAAAW